ncbi:RNA 2',3'-cyclic phosphodiesterase [Archaeoglobus neptunius]|uniref:RNA 2',3'-cyclic phosphodiesterase n=1 Tax=Archaeoglobus neptunius TaxID=2798580 RepID=UPI001928D37E|nr:RNA 2',3'-cyclic phosphodiesterase [Archaeoglobus neptunius]
MRLFVAVDLDDDVRRNVTPVIEEFSRLNGIKAVEPENLHITLLFLGEVGESKVPAIEDSLSKISFEPFRISFEGMGAFPSVRAPRVIWIGVRDDGKLRELADSVHGNLKKLGFRRDKEFSAHLTVARVKRKNPGVSEIIEKWAKDRFGEMEVRDFKLKQSILKPQGPVYKDLRVFGHEG